MAKNLKQSGFKIDSKVIRRLQESLLSWYHAHHRDLPWRRLHSPYAIAVSEFMLQQTQVKTALPYYERWMKELPDWKSLAAASPERVLKLWEGLGYYRRARHLHALAREVPSLAGGELPPEAEALERLTGIGPYMAGAISSMAFHRRAPLVDGNVERVFARLFNIREDLAESRKSGIFWAIAEELLPTKDCSSFNQSLMELGALVCTPRNPRCLECPVRRDCQAVDPESLPVRRREAAILEEQTIALLTRRDGKFWLHNPGSNGRWKDFHRLPEFEEGTMRQLRPLGAIRYSITRYRVRATIVQAEPLAARKQGTWFSRTELDAISLPSPHRKALALLRQAE